MKMLFSSKQSLNRQILSLSLPAIVSNVTVPLLGLCDTAVSGHLGDSSMLAAIAVGSMMMNVFVWICGFLRMGTTGMTAQAFGSGDFHRQNGILFSSLLIALLISGFLVLLRLPIEKLLFSFISPPHEAAKYASEYFGICICGLPAILMNMAVSGWLVGMQNTVWPMIVAVSSNVINIILSYLLAFPFGLGFIGIAYGTLIANWFGLIVSIVAIRIVGGKNIFRYRGRLTKHIDKKFFMVNSDLFLRSACVMSVSLGVTAVGGRLGEEVLAVNAVLMQFFTFFSFFMDGFAFSGEALCGKFAGAGNLQMLKKSIRYLIIWSVCIAISFTLIYLAGFDKAVSLITDISSVRQSAHGMRIYIYILPLLSFAAFIYDGFYIGLTKTRRMFVTTLVATILFYSIILTLTGNCMLWVAFLGYLAVRGFGLGIQLPIVLKRYA